MSHPAQPLVRRIGTTAALLAWLLPAAALAGSLPPGFVYLRDVAPGIAQDMRYAGPDNFTGSALPGYDAAECVLRREVADALAKVEADLARQSHDPEKWGPVFGKDHAPGTSLGLKVYDCYRPTRAVAAFARWARTPEARGAPTKRFYPKLDKRTLFAGYIAAHSAHSEGIAVDLTLIRLGAPQSSPVRSREPVYAKGLRRAHTSALRSASEGGSGNPEPQIHSSQAAPGSPPSRGRTDHQGSTDDAPCTAPAAERAPDSSLDMGTGFDCFDAKAHTASAAVTPAQAHLRRLLVAAMRRRGFHNYFREWWHFSYGPRRAAHDFPIPPRR